MAIYHDITFNSYFQRFPPFELFTIAQRFNLATLASTSLKAFSVKLNPFAMGFNDIVSAAVG